MAQLSSDTAQAQLRHSSGTAQAQLRLSSGPAQPSSGSAQAWLASAAPFLRLFPTPALSGCALLRSAVFASWSCILPEGWEGMGGSERGAKSAGLVLVTS